jgi:hypothetical protein
MSLFHPTAPFTDRAGKVFLAASLRIRWSPE